ncbi:MAG TPA: histidine phosphatase family protein [Pyrinomonadaceae bacterium]|nr:histidine phosphatase family protein [Pyrinomonadaceae bacterium]
MKTLLLLRHARTGQFSPTGRDFDRPLVEQGRADALLAGQLLRRRQLTPDSVICSPALRARQTAAAVSEAAQLAVQPLFHERIYEAGTEQLIEVVAEAGGRAGVLLVVGHNPGLQELLERLTGERAAMSPATLVRIDLDIEAWDELPGAGAGRLVFALAPQATSS